MGHHDEAARIAQAGARDSPTPAAAPEDIFEPGRNCMRSALARRAAVLVDGEAYFQAFTQAALLAQRSILILAWDFDSRTRLRCPGESGECPETDSPETESPETLGPFLNHLVSRRKGLRIRILNWDYPMIYGTDREFPPLYGLGDWTPRGRIEMRYDNTHPVSGSHHQKIVVIDDAIAFSGGMDLTNRRWDTCKHLPDNPHRTWNDAPYPPFHDVMALVDGDAAAALLEIARDRWLRATGESLATVSVKNDPWPESATVLMTDVTVGISRTMPDAGDTKGIRENEALYLDLIARARRCIYIENQYFTADKLADAIAARLEEPDGPEVTLVLRLLSHGWLEEHTMHALRTRLVDKLRAADRWKRLGIYYPHVPGLKDGTCVDVHSKVMIVDDEWLRIGSANFCNRSMGMDSECDVTFQAGGDERLATVIRGVRNQLLGEHLDVAPDEIHATCEQAGSLNQAVAKLRVEGRSLRPLKVEPWPGGVITMAALADPEKPVSLDRMIDEFAPNVSSESGNALRGFLLMIAVVAVLTGLWKFTPLAEWITADRVVSLANDFAARPWAPIIVLLAYTPACFVLFPRPLITLFAVMAFGLAPGILLALSGILIAALVTYYIGRRMDRARVRRFAGPKLNRVSELLRTRGLLAVTALRIVPVAPFAVGGLVAGAIRVKLWHYTLGTLLGMMPGTLAMSMFGNQLEQGLRDPSQVNYWVVAGSFAALIALFVAGLKLADTFFGKRAARRKARAGA